MLNSPNMSPCARSNSFFWITRAITNHVAQWIVSGLSPPASRGSVEGIDYSESRHPQPDTSRSWRPEPLSVCSSSSRCLLRCTQRCRWNPGRAFFISFKHFKRITLFTLGSQAGRKRDRNEVYQDRRWPRVPGQSLHGLGFKVAKRSGSSTQFDKDLGFG